MSSSLSRFERHAGCIITWRDKTGVDHPLWVPGAFTTAIREATERIPQGGQVRAICTPKTILRDLQSDRDTADPYSVERQMLAKIGRMDLLPDHARQERQAS